MTEKLLFAAIALVALVVLAVVIASLLERRKSNPFEADWPFYAKKPLTRPEQVLYHRLVEALPERIVLAQVQLSRVLGVKRGYSFREWNNRINRMSVDFVVCLKDSSVVAAVELDDSTHQRSDRMEADSKKEKALSSAGIALVRWHVNALPDTETIRTTFAN